MWWRSRWVMEPISGPRCPRGCNPRLTTGALLGDVHQGGVGCLINAKSFSSLAYRVRGVSKSIATVLAKWQHQGVPQGAELGKRVVGQVGLEPMTDGL